MAEQLHSTINGRVMDHGRTHLNAKGRYDSYDLAGAKRGNRVRVDTVYPVNGEERKATLCLTKMEDSRGMAAGEGWEMARQGRIGRKKKVGAGILTLLARTRGSGPTSTPRVVLRPGLELGFELPETPNVIENMGAIASMAYMRDQQSVRERLRGLYKSIIQRD